MMTMRGSRFTTIAALLLVAVSAVTAAAVEEKCDEKKCPGPIAYYKSLGCTPVYENPGDCCAQRYDCGHVFERDRSKCYVNGHEYAIGEKLRDEDANRCDVGCICRQGFDGTAAFTCAIVDCFSGPPKPGCYRKNSPLQCCPGEEVCPEKPEDRAECVVNGKTFRDGEYFPSDDPDATCICQPGYEGKNVEPFCTKPKHPYCDPSFRNAGSVVDRCAPVYYSNQTPQTDCSVFTRCQNGNDTVIHNHGQLKAHDEHEDRVCTFGNLKMHLGDELNQNTDYSSACVKCLCEVPPYPTCQRLPDSECDITTALKQ